MMAEFITYFLQSQRKGKSILSSATKVKLECSLERIKVSRQEVGHKKSMMNLGCS